MGKLETQLNNVFKTILTEEAVLLRERSCLQKQLDQNLKEQNDLQKQIDQKEHDIKALSTIASTIAEAISTLGPNIKKRLSAALEAMPADTDLVKGLVEELDVLQTQLDHKLAEKDCLQKQIDQKNEPINKLSAIREAIRAWDS